MVGGGPLGRPWSEMRREGAGMESEVGSAQTRRSASQLRFLAPQSWSLANCVQFTSNPKQMGLCPAPTRFPHSPPDPGAPRKRGGGPPAPNQAARPPAGRAGRRPSRGAAQSSAGPGGPGPAPPWCRPLSRRVVSVADTRMASLPPHGETISPVVKHVDTGPGAQLCIPLCPTSAGHPWAGVLTSLCL